MSVRSRVTVPAAVLGVTLAACAGSAPVPTVDLADAALDDAVVALRVSPQLRDINQGAGDGFVVLVTEDGAARAVPVGPMDVGQLEWNDAGLFAAGPDDEFVFTDAGLVSVSRGSAEAYQASLFSTAGRDGFISVYNVGFGEDAYVHRVTTGTADGVESWDVEGLLSTAGQCGDLVVGITDIAETTLPSPVSAEPGVLTEALVQLYPEPADPAAGLLSVTSVDGLYVQSSARTPCVDGVLYVLSIENDRPDLTGNPFPVLRAWDTATGHHAATPLRDEAGAATDLNSRDVIDINLGAGAISDGVYWWITREGAVYRTDVATGQTARMFDLALTSPENGSSQFLVTGDTALVLDVPDDRNAPMDLSSYDLSTGERKRLLTMPGVAGIGRGADDMIIRDLAVEPTWGAQVVAVDE